MNRRISFQATRTAVAISLIGGFVLVMPVAGSVVALLILAFDFVFLKREGR
jgi:hypothetical protein